MKNYIITIIIIIINDTLRAYRPSSRTGSLNLLEIRRAANFREIHARVEAGSIGRKSFLLERGPEDDDNCTVELHGSGVR